VVERRSFDAWGKRRNQNGTAMTNAFVTSEVRHAFTGHEDLGELGLIHMNGRLYDPAIGRFISADPIVQYPTNLQNYNRYSYINNNPLSGTDPSGYLSLGSFAGGLLGSAIGYAVGGPFGAFIGGAIFSKNPTLRLIASIGAAVYLGPAGGGALFGNAVANSAFAGFVSGLIQGRGDLKAAVAGAVSGMIFNQIGTIGELGNLGMVEMTALHAFGGCFSAAFSGGDCGRGALSAGFAEGLGTSGALGDWGKYGNIARNAIIGGTASVLGGGKFENGAMTGAFAYVANCMAHSNSCGGRKFSNSEVDESIELGRYQANKMYAKAMFPDENVPWYGMKSPDNYVALNKFIDRLMDFGAFLCPECKLFTFYGRFGNVNDIYNAVRTEDPLKVLPMFSGAVGKRIYSGSGVSNTASERFGNGVSFTVKGAIEDKDNCQCR